MMAVSSVVAPTGNDQAFGVPDRALGTEQISYDILRYIPQESAEHYQIAPLGIVDGALEVGAVDPDDIHALDALNFIARGTGMPFKLFHISADDFAKIVMMYKGLGGDVDRAVYDLETERTKAKDTNELDEQAPLDLQDPSIRQKNAGIGQSIQEDAPAIKLVSTILRYAIDGRASDVHIEPQTAGVRVRYRVDGDLHTSVILPLNTHRTLVARIKVLSSIRLDESRKPQDGRFSASIDSRQIDFRVSTFPSYNGEKIVIRILDRAQGFIPLDQIGLSERNLGIMRRAAKRPHGLILVSGPTGSGKSTTLYSMLNELDRESKNVLSLEDPIEYYVDGVTQSQMRPEIGYTFANGLRTTLRQDPDVIMVGEIRDGETAKLAIQAALTGHLVLSTIHTNDSVGTIPRLIDMGVEPYLIPPVLIASISQRLVRTLTPNTGIKIPVTPSDRKAMEVEMESLPEASRFAIPEFVYEPESTPASPSGMKGRMAVFEVLEMSASLEKIVLDNPVDSKLWAAARSQGMLTVREDALHKAFEGKIPYTEVESLSSLLLAGDEEQKLPPETPLPEVSEAPTPDIPAL